MTEDFPGWTASQQISLCKRCDSQEFNDENIKPTTKYKDVVIAKACKINEKRKGQSTRKEK